MLLSTDVAALRVFDRKVLRKIFGPVRVRDNFSIRFNNELYELLNINLSKRVYRVIRLIEWNIQNPL